MGQEFKMSQEYFEDFDPEKFAAEIKARAAEQAAEEDKPGEEDGVDKQ
ncbi:hypothetical protein [Corynebacterium marinum]|uniref:Uncharacterized protein n=1 Tax=Corynebacterium marinum DSM 44953 TaxID=1224162 RepID=A0A0B6TN72_9CORY|nr:hypothetical protein [Corynebacterium marinum]AJK69333.1 hypothetical protein B840_08675 [Corynebacterium marinum DSM 44953]GGO16484.1 hypothetical protein GCM10010980_12860 [Corynebacterium marinum]